jgi:hypothetical protein
MYAMNIQNDVIDLVLCENSKSKQMTASVITSPIMSLTRFCISICWKKNIITMGNWYINNLHNTNIFLNLIAYLFTLWIYRITSSISCCTTIVDQNKWPTLLHGRADVTTRYMWALSWPILECRPSKLYFKILWKYDDWFIF